MSSPNLDLPHWVAGQTQPDIPSNSATDQQDLAENESITVTLPDADYDLLAADQQFAGDVIFDGVLTADRNVTLMVGKQRRMSVTNITSGGFSLIFKYAVAGDTVTVSNPSPAVLIQGDGTNVKRIADPDILGYPEETIPQLLVDYVLMHRGADDTLVKVLLDNLPGGGGGGGGAGGGAVGGPFLHARHRVVSGGAGGGSSLAASWQTRVLNTVEANDIAGASVAANVITLPAGTFDVVATAPTLASLNHKLRLRNTADVTTTLIGSSCWNDNTAFEASTHGLLVGRLTIAASKTFELQHWTDQAQADNGLGVASTDAEDDVYADIIIRQVPATGILVLRQDLPSGTDGGPSTTGRNIRVLDNVLLNTIAGSSVASNVITLPPGFYEVRAKAPMFDSDGHGLRVVDASGPTDLLTGPNEHSGTQKQNTANIDSGFITAVEIDIRLEHYCETGNAQSRGLGEAINEAGVIEVYAEMTIKKLA